MLHPDDVMDLPEHHPTTPASVRERRDTGEAWRYGRDALNVRYIGEEIVFAGRRWPFDEDALRRVLGVL